MLPPNSFRSFGTRWGRRLLGLVGGGAVGRAAGRGAVVGTLRVGGGGVGCSVDKAAV
jgi:hypothetical protein